MSHKYRATCLACVWRVKGESLEHVLVVGNAHADEHDHSVVVGEDRDVTAR
jgi:hypothetical protein